MKRKDEYSQETETRERISTKIKINDNGDGDKIVVSREKKTIPLNPM